MNPQAPGPGAGRHHGDGAGAVRFDRFMEQALYEPATGFFGSGAGRPGRRGDFLTSVEVGPLFGAVLSRALDAWWDDLGRPAPYTVVDAGAGAATLARAVRAAAPRCGPALHLVAVERAAPLRAQHPDFVTSLPDLPRGPLAGVVVANELLDNLPVRVLERTGEGWEELWIGPEGEELRPTDLTPECEASPGARVPVAAEAGAWVSDVLGRLEAGRLVVFDYGDTTAGLARRPWTEWLRTYRGHGRGGHPAEDPGTQDITCDVPFDQLPPGAVLTRQDRWLRRWGIDELVEEGRRIWAARAHLGDLPALRARSRVREAEALLDPGGLGGFAVAEWRRP